MNILTVLSFLSSTGLPQNNNTTIHMNMNQHTVWYLHPALWVVAAIILGVLIVAALRGDIGRRWYH